MTDIIDPPIETIPFDAFNDIMVKNKCFALNQRNTFIPEAPVGVYLRSTSISNESLALTKAQSYCSVTTNAYVGQTFKRGWCGNVGLADKSSVVTAGFSARIFTCKLSAKSTDQNVSRACKSFLKTSEPIVSAFTTTCRIKHVLATTTATGRTCVTRPKIAPFTFGNVRLRHYCISAVYTSPTTRWLCKKMGYAPIGIISAITDARHCRETERVNYNEFIFKRACSRTGFMVSIPPLNGLKVPLSNAFTCRITEVIPDTLQGQYPCRVDLKQDVSKRVYLASTNKYACRFGVFELQTAKRFRCGTVKLTNVTSLVYGRLLGGRPLDNFFTRSSGRMIGKLR